MCQTYSFHELALDEASIGKIIIAYFLAATMSSDGGKHGDIVGDYIDKRKSWKTSNLGSLLFKFQKTNDIGNTTKNEEDKRFIVLIWKHWDWLKSRHVYNFNNERPPDIFNKCRVKNCIFTGDEKYLESADAVVIHMQRGIYPNTTRRNRKQRWIFLNDESPINAFSMAKTRPKYKDLANMFNWSMTYRSDADVPVPYGRTVPLEKPLLSDSANLNQLVPYWSSKRRDKLASVLMSNCGVSKRMKYLTEIEKYLPLDVYGKCSKDHKNSCPGHFRSDCNVTSQYLFYLVLENSQCREYLTEKAFNNAYDKGAIPVIMGPKPDECDKILPPNSFLHINNFDKPRDLAKYIIHLSANDEALLNFHRWRNHFKIVNEHGYFGTKSFHYCRVCEALNYNDKSEKIYNENDLRTFLDPAKLCF
ncbi:4-galactosyl-N-acetylglucosaminide 3-alpha-L-fucosyltransferase FUT6-like [Zerene cesonia]|uniref:4-galactosyl-N-acetylglucosaminide 3-alpha-L-fucosyltransferase FUT6-like n=1 Tax=Zerene cesonia TaxID=33412 RepID=UPI0018E50C2C|nr:4-galactosyl-N-acetylglucosaminide 3-alpha-L-fucosyltransferase FUT6-like [Zerene cesonia]